MELQPGIHRVAALTPRLAKQLLAYVTHLSPLEHPGALAKQLLSLQLGTNEASTRQAQRAFELEQQALASSGPSPSPSPSPSPIPSPSPSPSPNTNP